MREHVDDLQTDAFDRAFQDFASLHAESTTLGPRLRSLVALSVCAAATHLHVPGIRQHVRAARDAGATAEQVAAVLHLASTLGIHAASAALPILADVLEERGWSADPAVVVRGRELKREFMARRGYWSEVFEDMARMDPDLFDAYMAFSEHVWSSGSLTVLERELICIGFDCAATHMYGPGTRIHIANALDRGATPAMIREVIHIASLIGVHTVEVAMPILSEEYAVGATT